MAGIHSTAGAPSACRQDRGTPLAAPEGMRRTIPLLAGLLAACGGDTLPAGPAGSPAGGFEPAPDDQAVVSSVIDGETLQLADGRRVSLLGVDAPEGDEPCAREAHDYLERLAGGREVELDVCPAPPAGSPAGQGT